MNVPPSEVAAVVGVNESTLWRWEEGINMPRGDAAVRWADLLTELDQENSAAQVAA